MFQSHGGERRKDFSGQKSLPPVPAYVKNDRKLARNENDGGGESSEKPAAKSFKSTRKKENLASKSKPNISSDSVVHQSNEKHVPSVREISRTRRISVKQGDSTTESVGVDPAKSKQGPPREPAAALVIRETRASRLRAASRTSSSPVESTTPPQPPPSKTTTNDSRRTLRKNPSLESSGVESISRKISTDKNQTSTKWPQNRSQKCESADSENKSYGPANVCRRPLKYLNLESCPSRETNKKEVESFSRQIPRKSGNISSQQSPLSGPSPHRKWSISESKHPPHAFLRQTINERDHDVPGRTVDGKSDRSLAANSKGFVSRDNIRNKNADVRAKSSVPSPLLGRSNEVSQQGRARRPIEKFRRRRSGNLLDPRYQLGGRCDFESGGESETGKSEGRKISASNLGEFSRRDSASGSMAESDLVKPSILKSTSTGTSSFDPQKPISILKRKSFSQDEAKTQSNSPTFPVTFSPSAFKEDKNLEKKQGILKKRRSLDENEVRSERSHSPDAKPILKNQRRCSMEELTRRTRSPDWNFPQGILKRKCSKEEEPEEDTWSVVTGEPLGILKRKQSVLGVQHVKIPDGVVGTLGERSHDIQVPENFRPILKKKSSSEEQSFSDASNTEVPKSILKKKTSLESDEIEDKPKKPILKTSKTLSADEPEDTCFNPEVIKPILKKEHGGRSVDSDDSEYLPPCIKPLRDSFLDALSSSCGSRTKRRSLDFQSVDFGSLSIEPGKMKRSSSNEILRNSSPCSASLNGSEDSLGTGSCRRTGEPSCLPSSSKDLSPASLNSEPSPDDDLATENVPYFSTIPTPKVPKGDSEEEEEDSPEGVAAPSLVLEPGLTEKTRENKAEYLEESQGDEESFNVSDIIGIPRTVLSSGGDNEFTTGVICQNLRNDLTDTNDAERHHLVELLNNGTALSKESAMLSATEKYGGKDSDVRNERAGLKDKNLFARRRLEKRLTGENAKRFNTQPVSSELVQIAAEKRSAAAAAVAASASGDEGKNFEDEASTMSYSDRVRMFESALSSNQNSSRSRSSRYCTQPVTTLEVETAKNLKLSPLSERENGKVRNDEVSAPNQVSKRRNRINQSKSAITLELESILRKSRLENSSSDDVVPDFKRILRGSSDNKSINRDGNLSGSGTTGSDHENGLCEKETMIETSFPSSPYLKNESRSAVQRRFNKSRNNSSIVKSQSHSGVSSVFHGKTPNKNSESSSSDGTEPGMGHYGESSSKETSFPDGTRGIRRSITQQFPSSDGSADDDMSGATIQERLARLKKNGESGWQKRKCQVKNVENELSLLSGANPLIKVENALLNASIPSSPRFRPDEKEDSLNTSLADRLNKLDAAQSGWKKRVQPSDAVRFSVEGKMASVSAGGPASDSAPADATLLAPLAKLTHQKRSPKAVKFRSKDPSLALCCAVEKAKKVSGSEDDGDGKVSNGPVVSVPKNDDETFTSFFNGFSHERFRGDRLEINDEDLDVVTQMKSSQLLVKKKNIKTQRRRATVRNPLKSLASRLESQEYVEIKTGVAQKELRRINIEKGDKVSHLAIEALAGLASQEDFTAVNLKKASEGGGPFPDAPYKDLMLMQVKGRRHVQTRLVEPVASSLNSGDCFILVTRNRIFHYVGKFANVIERSRGAEISLQIQQRGDLGCVAESVITIGETGRRATTEQIAEFWTLLGGRPATGERGAGTPEEDEIFESRLVDTNMVYELVDDELVPNDQYWGSIPKIEILDPDKVLVFDFGSEFYVWNGKGVSVSKRKIAMKLSRELWEEGFDYSDCALCPLTAASFAGSAESSRRLSDSVKVGTSRPPWALFAKITQNMETVLFREKFLDWPDYTRVIKKTRRSEEDEGENEEGGYGESAAPLDLKPCDPAAMVDNVVPRPDLVLEGSHLGRGVSYYDEETRRLSEVATRDVTVWHINEYEYSEVPKASLGQFHMGDSYVVRWYYTVTVVGRELSGQPSKHLSIGRDRYAYFCWQGQDSPINDKGAAACLTVELDKENGPQVRVTQGFEPPAFLNMFLGKMVVHFGKRASGEPCRKWRLFISRGETESESVLFEVPCSMESLRSAACFVFVNRFGASVIVWQGSKSSDRQRKVAMSAARGIQNDKPEEFEFWSPEVCLSVETEGDESKILLQALGTENRELYCSLVNEDSDQVSTPRLFFLSSISGDFHWTEVASPYLGEEPPTPFPFLQADLYSASQPALFLLDAGDRLWLWQGWQEEDSEGDCGSGKLRFQVERRAAMSTAVAYWSHKRGENESEPWHVYLIWAGLEPTSFKNLFPFWSDRNDIAQINIKEGRKPGEMVPVQSELERLSRSFYSLSELQNRPLPEGVNPNYLEYYLKPHYFQELFGLDRDEFFKMPSWKKKKLKQEAGLF